METQTLTQIVNLTGKGAIVTGGSMGIGQGIAFRLAEAGAGVMIAARNQEAANQTVKQIRARGGKAQAIYADTRVVSDASKVAQATVDAFGSLDILVNNAGVFPVSPVLETSEELWDNVLDTNLKGVFFYSQAAARQMIKAGHGGKIINISSIQAFRPIVGNAVYGASKGGIVSITKGLAQELLPHGIVVTCVAAGGVVTSGIAATFSKGSLDDFRAMAQKARTSSPLGAMGEPDDIAKVVIFLASSAGDFMTSSVVLVDNGRLLK